MSARDAFRVVHTRAGRGPAFLAAADRVDHVEVVELDGGEVVFFWDLPPREAGRVARALREDLGALSREEFLDAWREAGREELS
jgi:hypothetical protein